MDWSWVTRLFDPYERQARIAPALLMCLPVVTTVTAWFPWPLAGGQLTSAGVATYLGVALLATIARDAGKRAESTLYRDWGGVPTTQLLRHRNTDLDATTKQRIHAFLGARVPGIRMPSADDEGRLPDVADEAYASAVAWLREQTRDAKKFPLVLAENIGYGFRRNCFGVRRPALGLALVLLVLNVGGVLWAHGLNISTFSAAQATSIVVSAAMAIVWLAVVRESWVKDAGFDYAHRLLAACDSPSLATSPAAKGRTKS